MYSVVRMWPGVSCFSSTGFIHVPSLSQINTIVNARPKLRIHLEEEVSHQISEGSFALGAGETREKRTDLLDNLHVPSEHMYIPAMSPLAYNRKSLVFNWPCQLVRIPQGESPPKSQTPTNSTI